MEIEELLARAQPSGRILKPDSQIGWPVAEDVPGIDNTVVIKRNNVRSADAVSDKRQARSKLAAARLKTWPDLPPQLTDENEKMEAGAATRRRASSRARQRVE